MKTYLETLKETLDNSVSTNIEAKYENNKIILTKLFNKETRDEVKISTKFNFDMDSLLAILSKVEPKIGEEVIKIYFEDEALFEKIFPLVLKHDYNAIARIIINHRGIGVSRITGII